jgi:plasmid stability protein
MEKANTHNYVSHWIMANRNITLNLPADLIRDAKVYAAQHDTTVNALVRELLKEKVSGEDRALAAAKRILKIARCGPNSTVDPRSYTREELHERW